MFKEPSFVTIICEDEDDIGTVTFTEEEDDKAYINSPQIYKCIKLKELRLEKSLTQKQLSQLTKIPLTRLRKLENLNAYANIGELICLSRFLNVCKREKNYCRHS